MMEQQFHSKENISNLKTLIITLNIIAIAIELSVMMFLIINKSGFEILEINLIQNFIR